MFDSVALFHPAVSISSLVWTSHHSFCAAALIKLVFGEESVCYGSECMVKCIVFNLILIN